MIDQPKDSTTPYAQAHVAVRRDQKRRDKFARAALNALLTGDPNMPTRIAVRHAWATANAMIDAEPDSITSEPS